MSTQLILFVPLGGPYNCFAGKDASRALANMSLADSDIKEEFDDLQDLDSSQLDQLKEWEMQFKGTSSSFQISLSATGH